MYASFLREIMNQRETADKVEAGSRVNTKKFGSFNINYLNDNVMVLFWTAVGPEAGKIIFAKGAIHLGYQDKELIDAHYS
jgi:hypothetical protein